MPFWRMNRKRRKKSKPLPLHLSIIGAVCSVAILALVLVLLRKNNVRQPIEFFMLNAEFNITDGGQTKAENGENAGPEGGQTGEGEESEPKKRSTLKTRTPIAVRAVQYVPQETPAETPEETPEVNPQPAAPAQPEKKPALGGIQPVVSSEKAPEENSEEKPEENSEEKPVIGVIELPEIPLY